MNVIPWPAERAAEWDRVVTADPDGTFDHLAAWRQVMTEALGHSVHYWGAVDETGALEGVLPLVRVRSLLFGHYLVSMPFLNAGGALGTPRARDLLVAHAVREAQGAGADLLELRTRGAAPFGLTVSERKITHVLPLPGRAEELWGRFPGKLRSQIRRAEKDGLVARTGPAERESFYRVFSRHMRALGTPVLPASWFASIATHLPGEAVFVVVYAGETPVAGACGFVWRGGCEITWASALREWQRSAPNMLLYWEFLRTAIARGCTLFDFGRCTRGSATHAFKRQWGGEDLPLTWGQWRSGAVAAPPSPDRPHFRLASACWRRLPLAVTERLGPHLARCLP